eukprot:365580-Chlamydomonas_euryale.AAC.17
MEEGWRRQLSAGQQAMEAALNEKQRLEAQSTMSTVQVRAGERGSQVKGWKSGKGRGSQAKG